MSGFMGLPLPMMADAYKMSHFPLYPESSEMSAYGEFRTSYEKDAEDHRIVFYGIRYIIQNYVSKKWTMQDIEKTEIFLNTFNLMGTPFPFPKTLFQKFVSENNGYFPVKIEALPEGTVIYPHVPVFQISAQNEYSSLVTFLETVITMVWYPSTVATLSRRAKHSIAQYFDETVDSTNQFLLSSRLQDFGFRGCTSLEQSIIGGCAHLVNFEGTDTLSAAYYAQFELNNGKPVSSSIPATEHSVMTAYPTELEALKKTIEVYGHGMISIVMDSYDYANCLNNLLPSVAALKLEKGGFLVIRPDSGDYVEAVIMGLEAGERVFGTTTNNKGYKVINGCSVIQGDGISPESLKKILEAVKAKKFSAENVVFGMGGGLLQKVNRDTMSFATKLSMIMKKDGTRRDIMKTPKTDSGKISLPGSLMVFADTDDNNIPKVYPKYEISSGNKLRSYPGKSNLLQVVYNNGPISDFEWDNFDTIRNRVEEQWNSLPPKAQVISKELEELRKVVSKHLNQ
ncbi:hypothetical protein BB559_005596 [Furculomyces boomerangus]|uniref:Nicotinamide phosphoribosyltransferase n=1 Tax=Furculomyces boomerangus TaxID=61424 RepID=A0A2T9Y7T6_9FUNG|nr:hypothetical protein BB559_005596 [Furculomyces boomerangus]